jgi:hypothetical protein
VASLQIISIYLKKNEYTVAFYSNIFSSCVNIFLDSGQKSMGFSPKYVRVFCVIFQNMCMTIFPYCVCAIGLKLCCFRACHIEMIIEIFPHTNPSQLTFCLLLLHVTGKFLNSCSRYLKFSELGVHLFIFCCRTCIDVRYYNQNCLILSNDHWSR